MLPLTLGGRNGSLRKLLVLTGERPRAEEASASAAAFPGGEAHVMVVRDFRDGFLPYEGAAVKEDFEERRLAFDPDPILSPRRDDAHRDQRLVAELALLDECFPGRRGRSWFRADSFRSLLRLRGVECNSPTGYAESFCVRKVVLPRGEAAAVDHDAHPQPR